MNKKPPNPAQRPTPTPPGGGSGKAAAAVAGKAQAAKSLANKPDLRSAASQVTNKVTGKLAQRLIEKQDLSTKSGQKKAENAQLASDLVSAAASGAASGATKGGAAGAAVGAALGSVRSMAGSSAGRRKLLFVIIPVAVLIVLATIAPAVLGTLAAMNTISALTASRTGASSATMQSVDASLATLNDDDQSKSMALAETARGIADAHAGVPWTVVAAAISTFSEEAVRDGSKLDITALELALDSADPNAEYRDISRGAVRNTENDQQHQVILSSEDGGDPERFEHFSRTEEIFQTALVAAGAGEGDAKKIFALALEWELGVLNHCAVAASGSAANSGTGGNAPAGSTVDTFNAGQVANGEAIVGMAKGMFGDDWEQAAIIGVMTALQESGLKIYANDGVMGNRPGEADRGAEYPKSAYDAVAKSVDLPHQAVGSDYVSLGLFQQQLVGSWGNLDEKNFRNDPDGQMRRLMDPAFSAFAFFRALEGKNGWQDMDPVQASHLVQVSANAEAPRKHLATAKEFVSAHSGVAAIPRPDGAASSTGSSQGVCSDSTAATQVVGGFAHPIGDSIGWSTYSGEAQHAHGSTDWLRPAGTQVFALAAGTVISTSYSPMVLWCVSVKHTDSLGSSYCHIDKPVVAKGDQVKAGQKLAVIAPATPFIQEDHLHFTITKNTNNFFDVSSHFKTAKFLSDHGINPGPCYRPGDPCALAE